MTISHPKKENFGPRVATVAHMERLLSERRSVILKHKWGGRRTPVACVVALQWRDVTNYLTSTDPEYGMFEYVRNADVPKE